MTSMSYTRVILKTPFFFNYIIERARLSRFDLWRISCCIRIWQCTTSKIYPLPMTATLLSHTICDNFPLFSVGRPPSPQCINIQGCVSRVPPFRGGDAFVQILDYGWLFYNCYTQMMMDLHAGCLNLRHPACQFFAMWVSLL